MSPRNSSRDRRRTDFAEREERANSAPFTVSGRLGSAKICRLVLVKYGASARASSGVNVSAAVGMATVVGYCTAHAKRLRLSAPPRRPLPRLRRDGPRQSCRLFHLSRTVPPDVLARGDWRV